MAVLAAFLLLGSWAVSSPTGSSADDDFHLPSIWCRSDAGREACVEVDSPTASGVSAAEAKARGELVVTVPEWREICFRFESEKSGVCPVLERDVPVRISDTLYPPFFYNYASLFAGPSPADGVVAIRLGVAASVIAIFLLAYVVALPWLRGPMLVSWVATSMPLGVVTYASTNPSAWAVAGIAAMWGPMVTAYVAQGRRRWWALGVWLLAALMAAGSRGDAAVFAAVVSLLGAVLLFRRTRWPMLLASALSIGASMALFLSSGHFRLATDSFADTIAEPYDGGEVAWSVFNSWPTMWSALTGAPWGQPDLQQSVVGWLDVPMPAGVWQPILLVLGGLVFAGMRYWGWRKTLAVLAVLTLTIALPARSLAQVGALMGTLFQPRYMLPLLVLLVGLLLVWPGRRLRLAWPQLIIMWFLLVYAGTVALHAYLRRYTTGTDVKRYDLSYDEWWEFTAMTPTEVWALGSVAWAVLVGLSLGILAPRGVQQLPAEESASATIPVAYPPGSPTSAGSWVPGVSWAPPSAAATSITTAPEPSLPATKESLVAESPAPESSDEEPPVVELSEEVVPDSR